MKLIRIVIILFLAHSSQNLIAQYFWNGGAQTPTISSSWNTSIQLAHTGWGAHHMILFNANPLSSLNTGTFLDNGNTVYSFNPDQYTNGAGAISFIGNGGRMEFFISEPNTGQGQPVNWGASKMTLQRNGNIGIGVSDPGFTLSLPAGDASISLGKNIFVNGQSTTGRISYNAFISNGNWALADANEFASTIELRSNGVIDMYGTTNVGQLDWKHMFGIDAPSNKCYFPNGNVGIGTMSPTERLSVNGTIRSKEVKVEATGWPDYVFEESYDLRTLEETKAYIEENKHLPEIPSAKEMEANGVALGEMNMLLLKKIEELTLYVIQLQTQNVDLTNRLTKLEESK